MIRCLKYNFNSLFYIPKQLNGLFSTTNVNIFKFSTLEKQSWPNFVSLIGLEIHAQLPVNSKLFTRIEHKYGAAPNTLIGLNDIAIPGSMPILNQSCLEKAVAVSLALNCHINRTSYFDRKHYFYADLPSGYQITQYYQPVAQNGYLDYIWFDDLFTQPHHEEQNQNLPIFTKLIPTTLGRPFFESRCRIRKIQIEQDTGKSLHDSERKRSLIDLNRADVGLVEIVTEPDFTSSKQACSFLNELICILNYLKCSHIVAARGELRVDVNVSVGQTLHEQGSRTEIKNLNSVRNIATAIDYEIQRQTNIVRTGGQIIGETRSYDPIHNITLPLRDKEVFQDYRYMPEPNLPPVKLLDKCPQCVSSTSSVGNDFDIEMKSLFDNNLHKQVCINCVRQKYHLININNLSFYKKKLLFEYNLTLDKSLIMVENMELLNLFEQTVEKFSNLFDKITKTSTDQYKFIKEIAFWITGHIYGSIKYGLLQRLPSSDQLAEFVYMNLLGEIHGPNAEQLLNLLIQNPVQFESPRQLALKHNLILIYDPVEIGMKCEQLIQDHPKFVRLYKNGRKFYLKKLLHNLVNNPKYNANKFNLSISEQILKQLLNPINDNNNNSKTIVHTSTPDENRVNF